MATRRGPQDILDSLIPPDDDEEQEDPNLISRAREGLASFISQINEMRSRASEQAEDLGPLRSTILRQRADLAGLGDAARSVAGGALRVFGGPLGMLAADPVQRGIGALSDVVAPDSEEAEDLEAIHRMGGRAIGEVGATVAGGMGTGRLAAKALERGIAPGAERMLRLVASNRPRTAARGAAQDVGRFAGVDAAIEAGDTEGGVAGAIAGAVGGEEAAERFEGSGPEAVVGRALAGVGVGASVGAPISAAMARRARRVDKAATRALIQGEDPFDADALALMKDNLSLPSEAGGIRKDVMTALARTGFGALGGGAVGGLLGDEVGAAAGAAAGVAVTLGLPASLRRFRESQIAKRSAQLRREAESMKDASVEARNADIEKIVARNREGVLEDHDVDVAARRILSKIATDPTADMEIQTRARRVVREVGKERVPDKNVKETARRIGVTEADLDPNKVEALLAEEVWATSQSLADWNELLNIFARRHSDLDMAGVKSGSQLEAMKAAHDFAAQRVEALGARLFRGGTELGRAMRMLRMQAKVSFDPNNAGPWLMRAKKLLGNNLTVEQRDAVLAALRSGDQDQMRKLLVEEFAQPSSLDERMGSGLRAMLLSGVPGTDVINIASSTSHMAMRFVENPIAAGIDRVLGPAVFGQRSIAAQAPTLEIIKRGGIDWGFSQARLNMFGTSKPGTMATVSNAFRTADSPWRGLQDAAVEMREALRRGIASQDPIMEAFHKFEFSGTRWKNPWIDAIGRGLFNRMAAEEKPLVGIAFFQGMFDRAKVRAMNNGLDPGTPEFQKYVTDLMADTPDDIILPALADARLVSFTNESMMQRGAGYLQKFFHAVGEPLGLGRVVEALNIPFGRALGNVATSIFVRTPGLGMANVLAKSVPIAREAMTTGVTPKSQRAFMEALAQQVGPTMATVAAGVAMARVGIVTGAQPPRAPEPNLRRQKERPSNAINVSAFWRELVSTMPGVDLDIPDDPLWVSLGAISPVSELLLMGADLYQYMEDPDVVGPVDIAKATGGETLRRLAEVSFLSSVAMPFQAITDPQRFGSRYVQSVSRMTVPTVVRRFTPLFDDVRRDASNIGGPGTSLGEGLHREALRVTGGAVASTPGASQLVEPQVPVVGPDRRRKHLSAPERVIDMLLPVQLQREVDDEVVNELDRIGVGVSQLQPEGLRDLPRQERTAIAEEYLEDLNSELRRAFNTPRYRRLNDEQRADEVGKFIQRVRRETTTRLRAEGRLPPSNTSRRERVEQIEGGSPRQGSRGRRSAQDILNDL